MRIRPVPPGKAAVAEVTSAVSSATTSKQRIPWSLPIPAGGYRPSQRISTRPAGALSFIATIIRVSTEPLQTLLERAFPDATEVRVEDRTGGGDHFQVSVTSRHFNGLSLLDQHRLVNEALAEPLRDGTIHELRIKTKGSE